MKKLQILYGNISQNSGYRGGIKALEATKGGLGMKHTVYLKIYAFYLKI